MALLDYFLRPGKHRREKVIENSNYQNNFS